MNMQTLPSFITHLFKKLTPWQALFAIIFIFFLYMGPEGEILYFSEFIILVLLVKALLKTPTDKVSHAKKHLKELERSNAPEEDVKELQQTISTNDCCGLGLCHRCAGSMIGLAASMALVLYFISTSSNFTLAGPCELLLQLNLLAVVLIITLEYLKHGYNHRVYGMETNKKVSFTFGFVLGFLGVSSLMLLLLSIF